MDLSKLHSISNNYQDVRLVSLKDWRNAAEISPRDQGGPYVVIQEGYDPADLKMTPDEFILGKSGEWISTSVFFKLPTDLRRQEFVFGTAAEVIQLLEGLPTKAKTVRKDAPLQAQEPPDDDLSAVLRKAKSQPASEPGATPKAP